MEKTDKRIWGVYNTFDNLEVLKELDEIDIWRTIDKLSGIIFWTIHDSNKPWGKKISKEELKNAQYNLEYLVYFTRNFGVEFTKEPSKDDHIERSESYDAWFRFWYDHFKLMSKEEYKQFIEDKSNGKDISKYMPSSSWKETLKSPDKKLIHKLTK